MKATVTRRETFNAAHRLFNRNWDNHKNEQVFGKCSNPNYHGHNYTLYVSVTGEICPETGYVIDLNTLKKILQTEVLEQLDHKNLNIEVEEFKQTNPTVENIAVFIYKKLKQHLEAHYLVAVKLYETENNIAEITD